MKKNERDLSIDIIRIIACFMVVGIHVSMEGWYNISPRTYTWTVLNFYDTLFRPAVPLFFMISGSLMLSKERIDFKRLWLKNILHLAIVYIVWAVFYAIMNTGIKKTFTDPKIIFETVFGPNPQYHLWYLRSILNIYAISPLLWILVHGMDKRHFRYFLVIFFVFGLLKSSIYELPFLPAWLHEQINLFVEMDLVGYSGYFILGYFLLSTDWMNRFSQKNLSIVYVFSVVLAAGLNQWIAAADNWPTQALYGNFSIPVAIEAVCIILLVKSKYAAGQFSIKQQKFIQMISESTLFVYLIHPFIIQRLQIYFHLYTINYNVLISVPVMILFVFSLSVIMGYFLKKIPVLNKIL